MAKVPIARSVTLGLVLLALMACGSGGESGTRAGTAAEVTTPSAFATPEPPASNVMATAAAYAAVDLATCLRIATGEIPADDGACPGFISTSAREALATCRDVGGTLVAAQAPSLQSLDVNGDGEPEFLYDYTENFHCDGAASVFSCGSLGCPALLIEKRDGRWNTIGYLRTYASIGAEVMEPEGGSVYGAVREGCGGQRPCDELWYHRWDGDAYQTSTIEVRGHVVEFANDGLWTLAEDTWVLAEPSPAAAVLETYPPGTDVVVLGGVHGTPYRYVSPCNACKNGFIDGAVMRKTL